MRSSLRAAVNQLKLVLILFSCFNFRMSDGHGRWSDYRSSRTGEVQGSSVVLGPVFRGEVYRQTKDGWSGWRATLNGEDMAGYPTMAAAKARIDWEMWNRLRQMRESFEVLIARKSEWEDGGNKYRPPEYWGAEAKCGGKHDK
jgi:hypothetical protein